MSERTVLAACLRDRGAFRLVDAVQQEKDWTEQGKLIYDAIADFYTKDPSAVHADSDIILGRVTRGLAAEKHVDMFRRILDDLNTCEVSPPNVADDFIEHRRTRLEQELAKCLLESDRAGAAARSLELGDIEALFAELDEETTDTYCGADLWDLLGQANETANLIRVYPDSLNDRLDGGLKRGHHVVIFARPEMGKTMTVINMIAGFAQDGRKVLYIGNEDPIPDIGMRIVNRLTGWTKVQVLEDLDGADMLARERGWENIILKGLAPGTPREIAELMEEHKPDVLVLDQLRNLDVGIDHFTQALESAAKQARAWAKRYSCVVVSVTQAGDSASGKAHLDLGDCDSSNTGIPATADVMLGLGATDAHRQRGEIVMSLPKNKVSGRHEYFTVRTNPALSKITSLD